MSCERIDLPDGFIITCTRGRRAPALCSECKWRPATLLCDYELRGAKAGATCSRKLCSTCRAKRGELDLCPAHARVVDRAHQQLELGGLR